MTATGRTMYIMPYVEDICQDATKAITEWRPRIMHNYSTI